MAREALLMSDLSTPTPEQKSLKPPPVPRDSTLGVGKDDSRPKVSATAVEKGKTVEEPAIQMESRAIAWVESEAAARVAAAAIRVLFMT